MSITTERLNLLPATVAHARAELGDRVEFSRLIQAEVPENWPPESTVDALPLFLEWLEAAPQNASWFGWYAVANPPAALGPVLIGSVGFLGPPLDGEKHLYAAAFS